ncbi:MAG: hypothetical protein PQJ46_06830 [Spirochaetales bacterium]|nr:hypothetical protein [Spirochaetales bacterium]
MNFEETGDNVYDATLLALEQRAAMKNFDIEEIRNELDALYIYQGHGWGGRGMVKDAEIDSQVIAYEVFLSRLGR